MTKTSAPVQRGIGLAWNTVAGSISCGVILPVLGGGRTLCLVRTFFTFSGRRGSVGLCGRHYTDLNTGRLTVRDDVYDDS